MTPLFTIIVSLLGCFCFYQWDQNRKDAEEKETNKENSRRGNLPGCFVRAFMCFLFLRAGRRQ